jgi:hypothetical protein
VHMQNGGRGLNPAVFDPLPNGAMLVCLDYFGRLGPGEL